MSRTTPPFRADHVGSLLRTAPLKEAREKNAQGKLSAEALKEVEDKEIRALIKRQQDIGLKAVTDGEFRRTAWQMDFLERIDGAESYEGERKIKFEGPQPKPVLLRVIGKLGWPSDHVMLDHFLFLKQNANVTPKMTIPSPSSMHFRYGREAVSSDVYPDMADFYADLGATYNAAVHDFYGRGCRYLQLDEVNLAYLCDPNLRDQIRARGENPDELPEVYAKLLNAAISDRPQDMVVTMHLCRGNFRSTFVATGGYEPVAEILFNTIGVNGYFMEYDTERAGGFEPLRLVPKGKQVILGIVTSKTGKLETKDELKRRIEEASKFIDLDQLGLSAQCGFSSTEEGNLLAEEEQWAKLELIVDVARDVWGGV